MAEHELGTRMKILLPATFEERGAAVPFTTPAVAYARVRLEGREELEALVPGLSGARGTYVLSWAGLRKTVSMSVYDRQLHKRLIEDPTLTPRSIRQHALELSKSGVSGTDRAKQAKEKLANDNAVRVRVRQVLLQKLIDRFGDQAQPLDIVSMSEQEAMVAAGRALSGFAKKEGLSGDHLIDLLIEWSRLIEPVGFPEKDCAGHMRQRIERIRDFCGNLIEWSEGELPGSHQSARDISRAAFLVVEYAGQCLATVDECQQDLGKTILEWQSTGKVIESQIERMDWFLDGWTVVLERWLAAADMDRHDQRRVIEEIRQFMPVLPEAEITPESRDFWTSVIAHQDGGDDCGDTLEPQAG